jgi:excisionase family DNA binding protein
MVTDSEVGSNARVARWLMLNLTKPFYSPTEVAELAGVHRSTILNYIAAGRLYAVKLSERTYRIPARSVLHLLAPEQLSQPVLRRDDDEANEAADRDIETRRAVGA